MPVAQPQSPAPGRLKSIPRSHSRQLPLLPIVPSIVHVLPSGLDPLATGTLCRAMQAACAVGAGAMRNATVTASPVSSTTLGTGCVEGVDGIRVRMVLNAREIYRVRPDGAARQSSACERRDVR